MNKYRFLLLSLIVAFLGGCTLAPKYTRPAAPIPADWPSGAAYQEIPTSRAAAPAMEIPWRQFFTDERLRKIIDMALSNNRDLRVAALKVDRARATYGIRRADLFPVIDAVGSGYRYHLPGDLMSDGVATTSAEYDANLGFSSWEIDFFGRLRSLKDAALEEYFATEEGRRSAQISLISEIAGAYLLLASDRESLALSQSTLESQQAGYDLIRRRYEVGLAGELDLRQEQTRVDAARVDVALYTRLAAQDENALNFLAGAPIPKELLPADLSSVGPYYEMSPDLSSEVLLRRPDILQAEDLLKAANASIGAARAAFFPRITLTTSFGTSSAELAGLFRAGSAAWSYAPQIVLPIFDPRTWSALDAVVAERQLVLAQYEKAIQTAFKEVADALAVRGTIDNQLAAQESLVDASAEAYRLSNARYEKGIDNFLGVLVAQRSLYAAQLRLINIRLTRLANQVKLYAVLGGGSD